MLDENGNRFIFSYTVTDKTNIMDLQHFHNFYEVYILLDGERQYEIGSMPVTISSSSVLIIKPGILHKAFSSEESLRVSAHLSFGRDFLSRFSDCLPDILAMERHACILIKHNAKELGRFVAYVKECVQNKSAYSEELIRCSVYSLFCHLEQSERLFELPINEAIPNDTVIRILGYLNAHIGEPFSLSEMAAHFGYNSGHISRIMKEYIGASFKDYISALRLKKSIKLLAYSDLTIGEIAFECGFESANYFGDFFRKSMGASPRDYRNNCKRDSIVHPNATVQRATKAFQQKDDK